VAQPHRATAAPSSAAAQAIRLGRGDSARGWRWIDTERFGIGLGLRLPRRGRERRQQNLSFVSDNAGTRKFCCERERTTAFIVRLAARRCSVATPSPSPPLSEWSRIGPTWPSSSTRVAWAT
jgi:hypothetical protein